MAVKTGARTHGGTATTRAAGIAGILAALALAGEFLFFSLSGFQQASFSDPASAIAFLRDHGGLVRVAVVFGAAGVALTLLFLSGLAERLRSRAPLSSAATLYFGIVGNVGDGLVALSFWIGIPIFVSLSGHEPAAAQSAWPAFTALTGGYQGFGNLFAGLSLLATGWAAVSQGALPRVLGAIALVAGVSAMASVLIANAQIAFVLALLLVIVFRVWAGMELYRGERTPAGAHGGQAGQVSAGSPTAAG
jgi:hypothetical protein